MNLFPHLFAPLLTLPTEAVTVVPRDLLRFPIPPHNVDDLGLVLACDVLANDGDDVLVLIHVQGVDLAPQALLSPYPPSHHIVSLHGADVRKDVLLTKGRPKCKRTNKQTKHKTTRKPCRVDRTEKM